MHTTSFKIVTGFILITMLFGCGGDDKPAATPSGPGAPPPPEVEVITVTFGKATMTQDLPGRLQAYRTAQVRARVEGIVEQRLFQEGSEVKAGDPLFRIDARNFKAAVDATRADLEIARQTATRYQSLLAIKAVSQQEYDLAAARVKQMESAMIRATENLENASVPAPIPGRIGRTLVTEGTFVGRGDATLLATIEQLDPIYVNFTQSGADLLRLRQAVKAGTLKQAAAKVQLVLEDGSIYPHTGNIFFTDMAVDPSTGAVSLRAEFANPQRELLPGMFVRVRFPEAVAENVIRIPQRAVQGNAQGQYVMVVGAENKIAPLPIKIGSMAGTDFIVSEGLKGGEVIIVNGLQKARPGAVVTPVGEGITAPSGQVKPGASISASAVAPTAVVKTQ
ncbi:MAG: efflux RND transporter periplasmic adaptor subunit [Candidatus Nitrotoga sp.]